MFSYFSYGEKTLSEGGHDPMLCILLLADHLIRYSATDPCFLPVIVLFLIFLKNNFARSIGSLHCYHSGVDFLIPSNHIRITSYK